MKVLNLKTNNIINLIENFAPPETQESWDNSGWQIDFGEREIKKIFLCLSITQNMVNQALENNCDMIISHHPMFYIPLDFNKNIPIYSAHTNLDKANGGTTDTLIEILELPKASTIGTFSRLVELDTPISLDAFTAKIKQKLDIKSLRVVNNLNIQNIKKIAFCAGSGAYFIKEAKINGAEVFVTGDVKYHQALESDVIIIDVGHFESEFPVLNRIQNLLTNAGVEAIISDEKSPFINY